MFPGIKNILKSLPLLLLILAGIVISDIYSPASARDYKNEEKLLSPGDSLKSDSVGGFYKEDVIDSIINIGKKYLGLHYRYGGRTPAGFDCSGYVSYLFSQFGYKLPPSSSGMVGVGVEIPYKEARKGDLILFNGRSIKSHSVGHVALIIDVDSSGVTMMHATHRGVIIDRYPQMAYYRPRFVGVRRVNL